MPEGEGEVPEGGIRGEPFAGAGALRGRSPKEVLHRLLDHDPFELEARSSARVDQRALLVSVSRVGLRALARVAYAAMRYAGQPPLAEWLSEQIDMSIEEILEEDVEAELSCEPLEPPYERHLLFVSQSLGIELGLARRACIRFNALPEPARRTFFALHVHGKSVHRWVAEGHGPPAVIHEELHRALSTLSAFPDGEDEDLSEVPW